MPRIPGLPDFAGTVAGDDEVPLYDTSADRTYGATVDDLATYLGSTSGGLVPEVPAEVVIEGQIYARQDGTWVIVPVQDDAASDGAYYARKDGAWSEVKVRATVETIADATHTPGVGTDGRYFLCTNGAGCAVTIPANADSAHPIGTMLTYEQRDASAAVTFVGDTGVTLNCPASRSAATGEQFAVVQVCKIGPDEWTIYGNLAAA